MSGSDSRLSPELRKDPVTVRWVIISAGRGERTKWPGTAEKDGAPAGPRPKEKPGCAFDPGREDETPPEITRLVVPGSTLPWTVRVIPNKWPALRIEAPTRSSGEGIYDRMGGYGAHEVIVESNVHSLDLVDLDDAAFRCVISAYAERVTDLARDPKFKYVLVFKNHGRTAGASMEHSHSQLIATPVVPKLVREELACCRQYWDLHERCIFCDMLCQELDTGVRVVLDNGHFVSFEPFAPRFPFETWILSRRHFATLSELTGDEIDALARVLKDTLTRLNRAARYPDYNYVVHTAPLRQEGLEHYHFHIEVIPKQTTVAGFEWGSGFFINPLAPEDAAAMLKDGGT